ncbi:hypothetical protein [Bacillus cereus group sp. BfR-BA-01318]|uniref:hypothetical protein n=1 Tax=Bacillus cereus group sp. BfR-BA-01318 TaxID=2920295 RepID=UPI001F5745D2|nr:hypothetical protein [Bacillus cereus group sp. BfR-BA-01318]
MSIKRYIKGDLHRPGYKGELKQEFFTQRDTFNDGLEGFKAEYEALEQRKALFEQEQKQLLAELHVKAMYEIDGKTIEFVDRKEDIPVFHDEREYQIAEARLTFMEQAPEEYTRAEKDAIKSTYNVLKAERAAFNDQYSLMTREDAMKSYNDALMQSRINEGMTGEEKLFPIVDTRTTDELTADAFNQEFEKEKPGEETTAL